MCQLVWSEDHSSACLGVHNGLGGGKENDKETEGERERKRERERERTHRTQEQGENKKKKIDQTGLFSPREIHIMEKVLPVRTREASTR